MARIASRLLYVTTNVMGKWFGRTADIHGVADKDSCSMKYKLLWDFRQRRLVVCYRRFGTTVFKVWSFKMEPIFNGCVTSQKSEDLIYTAAESCSHEGRLLIRLTLWATGLSVFAYGIRNKCLFFAVCACMRGHAVAWSTQNASRKKGEFARHSDFETCKLVSTGTYLQTKKNKIFSAFYFGLRSLPSTPPHHTVHLSVVIFHSLRTSAGTWRVLESHPEGASCACPDIRHSGYQPIRMDSPGWR